MPDSHREVIVRSSIRRYTLAVSLSLCATVLGFAAYFDEGWAFSLGYLTPLVLALILAAVVVMYPFTRRRRKRWYLPSVLTAALVALLASEAPKAFETYQARQYIALLRDSSGPEDLHSRLSGSRNPFILAHLFVVKSAGTTLNDIDVLIRGIMPPELMAPQNPVTASQSELRSLKQITDKAKVTARSAQGQVDTLFGLERRRLLDYLAQATMSEEFKSSVLKGVDAKIADYGPYYKRLFALKEAQYDVLSRYYSLLEQEHGHFTVTSYGRFVFENDQVVSLFNEVVSASQDTLQELERHIRHGDDLDARYQDLLARSDVD